MVGGFPDSLFYLWILTCYLELTGTKILIIIQKDDFLLGQPRSRAECREITFSTLNRFMATFGYHEAIDGRLRHITLSHRYHLARGRWGEPELICTFDVDIGYKVARSWNSRSHLSYPPKKREKFYQSDDVPDMVMNLAVTKYSRWSTLPKLFCSMDFKFICSFVSMY